MTQRLLREPRGHCLTGGAFVQPLGLLRAPYLARECCFLDAPDGWSLGGSIAVEIGALCTEWASASRSMLGDVHLPATAAEPACAP